MARHAAVLLLLLIAGCASVAPDSRVPQPQPTGPQAAAPQPAATAVAPTTTPRAAKPAATPVTLATPPAAPRVSAPTAAPAPLMLDFSALEAQLRATKAIGVFTKISLKNQVDDLMTQFREHYDGRAKRTMTQLRRSYDLLIMKVLSLLQNADPMLASAIASSREAMWRLLSDQTTFANL